MRFLQFIKLNEMPSPINDLENDDSDIVRKCKKYYDESGDEIDYTQDYKDSFTLYKMKGNHYMVLLITDKDDEFIGYVYMGPTYTIKNSVMIQTTEIITDRQGEGIATTAYKFLLDKFDYIISDEQLTDGSTALYKKLGKKYKKQILVKGDSTKKDELLDIDFEDDKAMKPYANRKDVRFVLSKN